MQADDLPPPSEMTYESALELLGVQDGASFDDILRAKKRQLATVGEDQELVIRVRIGERCSLSCPSITGSRFEVFGRLKGSSVPAVASNRHGVWSK